MRSTLFLVAIFTWAVSCQVEERDVKALAKAGAPVAARVCNRTKYHKKRPGCTYAPIVIPVVMSTTSAKKTSITAQPVMTTRKSSSSVASLKASSVAKSSSVSPKMTATSSLKVSSSVKVASSSVIPKPMSSPSSIAPLAVSSSVPTVPSSTVLPIASPSIPTSTIVPMVTSTSAPTSSGLSSSSNLPSPTSSSLVASSLVDAVLQSSSFSSTLVPSSFITSTKSASSSSTGLTMPSDYPVKGLYYHNKHRSNHSASALTWDTAQATTAAKIAASCIFAHQMDVDGGGYGQNLAAYGASGNVAAMDPTLMLSRAITNQWYYGEVNSFLPSYYGQPNPDPATFHSWGHFTQVIWKGSSAVGCFSNYCPAGTIFTSFASWFTVCNYVPPGNYLGEFDQNIGVPLGQPTIVVN